MSNTNKYLNLLEEEYNISNIAFLDLFLVFTSFMIETIEADQKINEKERKQLLEYMSLAYVRLQDRNKSTDDLRSYCYKQYEDLKESHPHLSNYYRILTTFFYRMPFYGDILEDLSPIELCLTLSEKLDATLPQKFYEHFKLKALETIF